MLQYKECWAYIRHLNTLAWQVPTATFTIIGALTTWILQANSSHQVKAIIVLAAAVFDLLMLILLAKHRNGIDGATAFKRHLEREIFEVEEVPIETKHIFRFIEGQAEKFDGWESRSPGLFTALASQRVYFWFQGAMALTFLLLTIWSGLLWCSCPLLYELGVL
jgi:hypothetical protein